MNNLVIPSSSVMQENRVSLPLHLIPGDRPQTKMAGCISDIAWDLTMIAVQPAKNNMELQFRIPGNPLGKGRPHFVRKTGIAFTPTKTRNYESLVRNTALLAVNNREPWSHPIQAIIVAEYPVPVSWTKKKKIMAYHQLISPAKPDLDNIAKIILDSVNRIVYYDDVQVVSLFVLKKYGPFPGVHVHFSQA